MPDDESLGESGRRRCRRRSKPLPGNRHHAQDARRAQEKARKWGGYLNSAREILRNVIKDIGWELEALTGSDGGGDLL